MGFRAAMTKASGDGGIDIVATLDQPVTGGLYLVQCKRYAAGSLVGAPVVREFYGALTADQRAVKGILITTSGFTTQAQEFARGLPIELIGRDELERLLERHGLRSGLLGDQAGSVAQPRDPLLAQALEMMNQKRYAEALSALQELNKCRPLNADVLLLLGACCYFCGLHDDQVEALREGLRLRPSYGQGWYLLGVGLHKVGDLDAAADALKRALEAAPDNDSALLSLGQVQWDKGNKDTALLMVEQAAKMKRGNVTAWFVLGQLRWLSGKHSEAVAALHEALRIDPNNRPSWEVLCFAYRDLGQRTRMLHALSRLGDLDPGRARRLRKTIFDE
jgi:tetratricopeptide (TPR) repeat protein